VNGGEKRMKRGGVKGLTVEKRRKGSRRQEFDRGQSSRVILKIAR